MANSNPPSPSTEPRSGFCSETKIFHSLRPAIILPNSTLPCSLSSYIFSLLHPSSLGPLPENPALIESDTGLRLSFPDLIARTKTLASSLKTLIAKGDVAFVLSPTSIEIPVLYLALLSLGVVVSPANPLSTPAEISRQATLSRPKIAFATSATAHKLSSLGIPIVLFDSPDFEYMMTSSADGREEPAAIVYQSDPAAILYSSGTTGNVKGVVLTHRNLTALVGGIHSLRQDRPIPLSTLLTVPLFHVYGFFYCFKAVAMGETVVLMKRFEMGKAMRAVEEYKVAFLTVAPPVVVEMVKGEWSKRCDLSSLEAIGSGGAPLGKETIVAFAAKFPNVHLGQGYGLTECTGAAFRTVGPEESKRYGSSGRLQPNIEAKIVDPLTGEALLPCKQGELWIRGPTIMQGYIGDEAATAETLDSEGWLKTGDLCYIDNDGFIYIVDRLKELIKYNGFQVAPAELEHLLRSHQDIADAAVIPYPDEKAGQIPMAFVVRLPQSTINQEQVMEFVAKQVSSYKKVRRVAFISSIPKNPAGKILRKDLIKLVLSEAPSKL